MEKQLDDILARLEETALGCGFTKTGRLNASAIKVRTEVRDACAADKCRAYGKSWSCPPACGSLEECEKRLKPYNAGLILQSTGNLDDPFDYEAMSQIGDDHKTRLLNFQECLSSLDCKHLLLGSGCCGICAKCSYPAPCNFPEKMIVSMEAMGIWVSELCTENNIPYYYGPGTLTYVGCLLVCWGLGTREWGQGNTK
jgi:predicted metal-binding protein